MFSQPEVHIHARPDLAAPDGSRSRIMAALVLGGLLIGLYAPVLKLLFAEWLDNPDYTHGLLVPFISGFVVWREWGAYSSVKTAPSWLGIPVMILGLLLLLFGTIAAELFTSRISLVIVLAGIVLYFFGWPAIRAAFFPLGYLAFMIPLPALVYNEITFPLQLIASRLASDIIALTGIPVLQLGNMLRVPNYSVEVVQACSGIRSLLSLIAMAVAYVYFGENRWWIRVVLLVSIFPIAIFTNALRVTVSCLLGYRFGAQIAEGFLHSFSGWLIFLAALACLFLLQLALHRIVSMTGGKHA